MHEGRCNQREIDLSLAVLSFMILQYFTSPCHIISISVGNQLMCVCDRVRRKARQRKMTVPGVKVLRSSENEYKYVPAFMG